METLIMNVEMTLGLVKDVSGTIEINTLCRVTKTKRKNIKDVKNHKPLSGYRKKVENERERVKTMQSEEENFNLFIDSLVRLRSFRQIKKLESNH